MILINLSDEQSIEIRRREDLDLYEFCVKQWGESSTTVYMTGEEVIYVAEFLLNYIDSVS